MKTSIRSILDVNTMLSQFYSVVFDMVLRELPTNELLRYNVCKVNKDRKNKQGILVFVLFVEKFMSFLIETHGCTSTFFKSPKKIT